MPRPMQFLKLTLQLTLFSFVVIFILENKKVSLVDLKNAEFWQPVYGSKHAFFVYSAFRETKSLHIGKVESPVIRVIGLAKLNRGNLSEQPFIDDSVYCQLSSEEEPTRVTLLKAHVLPIQEHWSLPYSACFIYCPIQSHTKNASIVSIYAASAAEKFLATVDEGDLPEAGNRLLINHPLERGGGGPSSLAVCVKPLYNNYSNVWELVEWIEVNKLLGFSHFYFYDYEVSSKVSCVLNEYVRRGEATVMDWKNGVPVVSQVDVRTMNMFAALNDCLYRGMAEHKYLAVFDVDEILVPRKSASLARLIEKMSSRNKNVASFVFRNAFFYTRWHNDPLYKGLDLKTLKRTRRKKKILPSDMRAKYVFRPELVLEIGNHAVWSTVDGAVSSAVVPVKKGLLHHYRRCEFGTDNCLFSNSVRDRTMWKQQRAIEERIIAAQNELMDTCGIDAFRYVDGSEKDNDTFAFPDIDDFY